ncbi:MAG TPA: MSMEG_4193 family putative phosphomutase [Actinomycetota bacterium]|nr:MSMEG_4193 family putative phosphomutase [Actinomycetota bacterium]
MTTFFLVRHAVTAHTGHKLSGRMPGVHLSDEGREQAEAVAARLERVPLHAVYSSPIDRTIETARPIAARHGLEVNSAPALSEIEFGRWTNRSFKALARTKMWSTVQRWPSGARFPEGETLRDVQSRAVDAVESLRARHPKKLVCCVSHADVIKLLAAHYLGLHIDLFQRIDIGPASVTVVAVSDVGPRVLALNAPSVGMGA